MVLFVDTPELKAASQLYYELFLPYRPKSPLDGPLLLKLIWHVAPNASAPASARDTMTWLDTPPDLDNMEKLVLDVMAKMGFITNDSRIALKLTGKVRNSTWHGLGGSLEELPARVGPAGLHLDILRELRITV